MSRVKNGIGIQGATSNGTMMGVDKLTQAN
jgi:hypothetical protein